MREKFIVFGEPLIEQVEIDEVVNTLRSGWLGTGAKVHRFEEMFAAYRGAKHAMAVSSCTAALHLSMLVLDLNQGDEVIVPAMTFAATANAVIHAGAVPVFADVQRNTMNLDPEDVVRKITSKTKAILPVHFAGRPCDMNALNGIAKKHNLKVIEDCAHSIETIYYGRKTGNLGDLGCFSFYVTKNLVTAEGGMIVTQNAEYAAKIKTLALHGMNQDAWQRFGDKGFKHYQVVNPGFKYNMTDIQASLGIHQLIRIERNWLDRRAIWRRYNDAFSNLPARTPAHVEPGSRHAYHLYTLMLDLKRLRMTRDQFLDQMTERKIGVGVHYVALHLHPYYQKTYDYSRGDFPNAEWISDRTVSLPLSPKLTAEEVDYVIENVQDLLGQEQFVLSSAMGVGGVNAIQGT